MYWYNPPKWYRAAIRTALTIVGFIFGWQFMVALIHSPLIVLTFVAVVYLIYSYHRSTL